MELLPGTEVAARGLRWEVVNASNLGTQTLYRLRGLEGALRGEEFDLLHPFEPVEPVIKDLRPERAGPLRNWLVYHQAFLLSRRSDRMRCWLFSPDAFVLSHTSSSLCCVPSA